MRPPKSLLWVGTALDDLRAFPADARRVAGHQLHLVQLGLEPGDWKPMPSVGPGVREVRIHTEVEHRVVYVASFREGVYVLHAFEKRTRRTPRSDIALARRRLRDVLDSRRRHAGRPETHP